MSEKEVSLNIIYSFLTGGATEIPINVDYEILARTMEYVYEKKMYHRKNFCRAIVVLSAYAPTMYRDIAWMFIQKLPLSHLLYLSDVVLNPSKENKRRLRHALAVKIANSSMDEIVRAYMISPSRFRMFFKFFKLPRNKIKNKNIVNKSYIFAVDVADKGIKTIFNKYSLEEIVERLKIPLHMVLQYVKDPDQAKVLAEISIPDDYLRHSRWFRTILGDNLFEEITFKKLRYLKDPIEFISVLEHLEKTGALTENLLNFLNKKINIFLEEEMNRINIRRIAIIVDVSASMHAAIDITRKLYEVFTRLGGRITDIIAFSNIAYEVSREKLNELIPKGMTSIGAGLLLLYKRLARRSVEEYPQAILLITDFDENTEPRVKNIIPLYSKLAEKPPIIVIHCGSRAPVKMDYPHAVIPVERFHPSLLLKIFRQIMSFTSKVLKEREVVRIIKEVRPLEEELSEISLPQRPQETMKSGYLLRLLSGGSE